MKNGAEILVFLHEEFLPFIEIASDEDIAAFIRAQICANRGLDVPPLSGMAYALYTTQSMILAKQAARKRKRIGAAATHAAAPACAESDEVSSKSEDLEKFIEECPDLVSPLPTADDVLAMAPPACRTPAEQAGPPAGRACPPDGRAGRDGLSDSPGEPTLTTEPIGSPDGSPLDMSTGQTAPSAILPDVHPDVSTDESSDITDSIPPDDSAQEREGKTRSSSLPLPLSRAMENFAAMRERIGRPLSDAERAFQLKRLGKLAGADVYLQARILEQSIDKGWMHVFPLRKNAETRAPPHTNTALPGGQGRRPDEEIALPGGQARLPDGQAAQSAASQSVSPRSFHSSVGQARLPDGQARLPDGQAESSPVVLNSYLDGYLIQDTDFRLCWVQ